MADAAPAPTKRTFGGGGDKCDICEKAVYATVCEGLWTCCHIATFTQIIHQ